VRAHTNTHWPRNAPQFQALLSENEEEEIIQAPTPTWTLSATARRRGTGRGEENAPAGAPLLWHVLSRATTVFSLTRRDEMGSDLLSKNLGLIEAMQRNCTVVLRVASSCYRVHCHGTLPCAFAPCLSSTHSAN
jgi:hypothetical protein